MAETRAIVFLDMDGVMNDESRHPRTRYCRTDPACVDRLDRILVETDARIVLTSAWRYLVHGGSMTLLGLANLLYTHWIDGDRLIGVTRRDTMVETPSGPFPVKDERGRQIADWRREHEHTGPYVVLDNGDGKGGDIGITAAGHPFVWTEGWRGLTDGDADRAISILKGQMAEVARC